MIHLKTSEEINIMVEGGKRLKKVVNQLIPIIKPGMTTKEIDEQAEKLVFKEGGEPSFKKVKGYYWTTCLPINEQVVHTPPSDRVLKKGDLFTLDIGMYYQGFHTDYATTLVISGTNDEKVTRFLEAGKKTLELAIREARVGNRIGQISAAIEKNIYGNGYYILKELTGHGIGRELHEDPYIFGFENEPIEKTAKIKEGLTIAIEIIYSMGAEEFFYEKDNSWSIVTKDKSLSACFEHTIAVTNKKTLILT